MKLIVLLVLMVSQTMIFSNNLSLVKLKNIKNEIMTTPDNGLTWVKVNGTIFKQLWIANLKDIHGQTYSSLDNGLTWKLYTIKNKQIDIKTDDFDIEIFPNPTVNFLHLSNIPDKDKFKLRISDINSNIVFEKNFDKCDLGITLDITTYKKGLYYLNIEFENKIITKLFIKQ